MTKYFIALSLALLLFPSPARANDPTCLNCHGRNFLLSGEPCSRWQKHSHPVNIKPSIYVNIPRQFPLNEKGEMDCNTCHDVFGKSPPSAEKTESDFSGKFLLRGKSHNSVMCKQCHVPKVAVALEEVKDSKRYGLIQDETFNPDKVGDFMEGKKTLFNHPVDIQMPRLPRQITDSGGKEGVEKDQIICETCHAVHFASGEPILVMDNSESELCGQCHAPKFGINRESTAIRGTHPVNIIPSTAVLSKIITFRGGKLGRNKKMVCLTCHSIHSAAVKNGLLVEENEEDSFCYVCHFDIAQKIEKTRHDIRKSAPETKNAAGLAAAEGGKCSPCHMVHQGQSIKMWSRTIEKPDPEDPIKSLCLSCHAKGKPGAAKQTGLHTHPTGVSISLADNPYVRLPLFSKGGIRIGKGMVTCSSCHDPHVWDPDSDDKGEDLKIEGGTANSFLRRRNEKSSLCLECHISPQLIEGTSHDLNTAIYDKSLAPQLVFKGIQKIEGEIGICDHCHTVHNAASVMLWARQIGTGDDDISSICFSCHSDSMVAQHKLIGKNTHPVNINTDALPGDINPDLPLFSDNLRKEFRGKIFCNTCHDSHRWNPNSEDKGGGAGGDGSNSYLRMSAADPGKNLCLQCHQKQGPVMKTPHDLQDKNREDKNLKGLAPDRSGTCGVCHATHNAATQVMLWNQSFGSGDDLFSRACNSCHGTGKHASDIGISHPVNVSTFSVMDDLTSTTMPVYDDKYRAIKIEMDPRLSPIQVQSILTLEEDKPYREDANMIRKFSYLKQIYIDIKREKEVIKERLLSFIEKKDVIRESLKENGEAFKQINDEVIQKSDRYQELKGNRRKLEQRVGVREGQLRSIRMELGIADPDQKQDQSPGNTTKSSSHGPPKALTKDPATPPPATGPSKAQSPKTPPKKRKLPRNKRLVKAEKEFREAKERFKAGKKEYALLNKGLKKIISRRDKMKKEVENMKKEYNRLSKKQGREDKKYKLLKAKMSEIKGQLKEINPRSFMEIERDLERELRIGEELLNESEMDYKIKYLTLFSKLDNLKVKKETVSNKYRSMRSRYMDLLLNKKLRKKISNMELDTVLDEELLDEVVRDVERDPSGKMFCPTCHNVHGEKIDKDVYVEKFLRIPNEKGYGLCINCHRDKEWIIGTDHDLSVTAPDEENVAEKTTGDSGVCSACHLVHNATDNFNLWSKEIDREKIDQLTAARKRKKELKKIIRLRSAEFKQVSGSISKIKSKKSPKTVALKKSKAKLARIREKLKKIDDLEKLSQKQRDLVRQKYKQQMAFLKKYIKKATKNILGSGKAAKKIKTDFNKLKQILKDAKTEYEILQEKINRMEVELSRSNWDAHSLLCNSCHAENYCAEEKVIGYNSHPMNVRGRHFLQEVVDSEQAEADGDEDFTKEKKATAMEKLQKMLAYPLYTQEGKRDFETGRMFCPTCHNVHQWDPQNPSRGSGVPEEGNALNSFLRDRPYPSPTLCVNCHPQNSRVVGTEHDLSVSAPYAKNSQGKTVADGGICSPCHLIHNSSDRYRLWARPLGPSYLPDWTKRYRLKDYKPVQLCTSCHQEGQWGEEKTPAEGLHYYNPLYYLREVELVLVNPKFPYFDYDAKGKKVKMGVREILNGAKPKYPVHTVDGKISNRGNISCFTCHDAHQWDPNKNENGMGIPVEGDVTNSFLKKGVAQNFCSDCHKSQALYNYAYFHLSRNRLTYNMDIKPDNPHWKKEMEQQSCATCHQDNPQDSMHPVKITLDKKSAQYKYPSKIPLDEGKIICATCHNPKLQTERFAMVRGKNRYFLRGLYDSLTLPRSSNKAEKVMVGGPPAAMLKLNAGPKNLGAFAKAREKTEDTTTGWIRMSKFIQYQVCYNCHKKENYRQFSPHSNQIVNRKINQEMCFLCHSEIPDRRNAKKSEEGFKLRAEVEFYCIDCHQDKDKKHPGGAKHFGKIMTKKIRKQFKLITDRTPVNRYLPLKGGKLICSSCHNIHQDGVILDPEMGNGSPEKKWLRLEGTDVCVTCHARSSEYTPEKSGSPF